MKDKIIKKFLVEFLILMLALSALPISSYFTSVNAAGTSTVPSNLLQYEWLGPQVDGTQAHFSAGPAPSSPNILWQKSMSGAGSYPAAFNGMLMMTEGNNIVALDPQTGNVIYTAAVPKVVSSRSCSIAPIIKIDNTHMITVSQTASVVNATVSLPAVWNWNCFNIADGSFLWSSSPQYTSMTPNRPSYNPETKMLYVGVGNSTGSGGTQNQGAVQAWNLPDPSQPPTFAWTYIGFCPVKNLNFGDGKIFAGNAEGHLTCLDAKTGDLLWDTLLPGAPSYAGTYYNGVIYRGLLDNTFVAINGTTGKIVWANKPSNWGYWASGTAAAYGIIFMTNVDGYFYAFNATTGDILWKYLGPGQYYPGFTEIADGKVYTCTGQGVASPLTGQGLSEFTCFNASTGEVLWQVNKEFRSGPSDYQAIAYGNFYAVNQETENGISTFSSPAPKVLDTILYCYGGEATHQDWSMYGGNPAHTATGSESSPVNMAQKWVYHTDGGVTSSPVVAQGKLYIGSDDRNWYCIDADSGIKIWNFSTGYYIRSTGAVANGKFYTGTDDGFIYCLDANTGSQLWKTATSGKILPVMTGTYPEYHSSPVVAEGKVYVGSVDCKLYCLDANSGNIAWTIPTTGAILSNPTYIVGDGLYFNSVNGWIFKVNPTSGNIIWNVSMPSGLEVAMEGSPCIGNGMVVIGSGAARNAPAQRGQMYCLNATTGQRLWTYNQQNYNSTNPNMQPTWTPLYLNHKTLGPVFYFSDFYHMTCVNATSGKLIWTTYLTREHFGLPAYSDNKLYIPADTFGIYVCDATTGSKLGYFEAGAQVRSSPALYGGKIYFGANNFDVFCVGWSSAATIYIGNPLPSPSPIVQPTVSPIPVVTPMPTTTPIVTPIPTATVAPTASPSATAPTAGISTETILIASAAVVIIAIVAAAAVLLKRRK